MAEPRSRRDDGQVKPIPHFPIVGYAGQVLIPHSRRVPLLTKYATPAYKEWFITKYTVLMQQIPKQQAMGVQLLAGTDLTIPFVYPGSSVHDEVRRFAQAGLTPLQALQTATTHPVAFFHLQDSLGSVATGKKAELLLLDGNPLQDLRNLDRVSAVFTHKKVFLRPELEQMETTAASAAQSYN